MRSVGRQAVRYAVVGLVSNAALYALFLVLIALGTPYGIAMTVSYGVGIMLAFQMHRNWTFRHGDAGWGPAWRFMAAYGLGYLLNLSGLALLVEGQIIGPALAQGMMIVVVAAFLFVLQRLWVFRVPRVDGQSTEPTDSTGALGGKP